MATLPSGVVESPVPKAVRAWFDAPCEVGVYRGKKILALQGGVDRIFPPSLGAARWAEVAQEAEVAERWIDGGFGHVVTPGMTARVAEWFWRWGITE
jgi:hypothetical protein